MALQTNYPLPTGITATYVDISYIYVDVYGQNAGVVLNFYPSNQYKQSGMQPLTSVRYNFGGSNFIYSASLMPLDIYGAAYQAMQGISGFMGATIVSAPLQV